MIRKTNNEFCVSLNMSAIQRHIGVGGAVDNSLGYVVKLGALSTIGSIPSHIRCWATLYRLLGIPLCNLRRFDLHVEFDAAWEHGM